MKTQLTDKQIHAFNLSTNSHYCPMTTIDKSQYTAHLHPGKFEGEPPETEYYWGQMLNGYGETIYADSCNEEQDDEDYDNDDPIATVFCVNAEESEAFGLPIGATYMIREDSQGFVYGSVHANRNAAERAFRQWLGLEENNGIKRNEPLYVDADGNPHYDSK